MSKSVEYYRVVAGNGTVLHWMSPRRTSPACSLASLSAFIRVTPEIAMRGETLGLVCKKCDRQLAKQRRAPVTA